MMRAQRREGMLLVRRGRSCEVQNSSEAVVDKTLMGFPRCIKEASRHLVTAKAIESRWESVEGNRVRRRGSKRAGEGALVAMRDGWPGTVAWKALMQVGIKERKIASPRRLVGGEVREVKWESQLVGSRNLGRGSGVGGGGVVRWWWVSGRNKRDRDGETREGRGAQFSQRRTKQKPSSLLEGFEECWLLRETL